MAEVGGPQFDDVAGAATGAFDFGGFVPQIWLRRAFRGQLLSPAYSVNAATAIGRREHVLQAAEVRDFLGLDPEQKLILQLFGPDWTLERLWYERRDLIPQVANAGYDGLVGPSYSLWDRWPRPEHLISLKRSLLVTRELQDRGSRVVPRVSWAIGTDVRRQARWIQSNPFVGGVGLDLGTYRHDADWYRQHSMLAEFDQLTERRLRYWIHGPTTATRYEALFQILEPSRVTLTHTRVLAAPPEEGQSLAERERAARLVVAGAAGHAAHTIAPKHLNQRAREASPGSPEPWGSDRLLADLGTRVS